MLSRVAIAALGALTLLGGTPAVAEPGVVTLGGGGVHTDPVEACGAQASSPWEAGRVGAGVTDAQIFIDAAVTACEAAFAVQPDNDAVQAWLGRSWVLVGRAREAMPLLRASADAGNSLAMHVLSAQLARPSEDGVDIEGAVALLMQAADAGFAPAMVDLGQRYELADGVEYLPDEAMRLYGQAAEAGLGAGSYKVGTFHHYGIVGEIDYAAAMAFYQQAVDQDEPRGYFGLGQLHEFGLGIAADNAAAIELYRVGAGRREPMSQTALAYFYEQGIEVEQDYARSLALLTDASGKGWGYAKAALAIHYLFGQGTAVDAAKAYDLAWQARQQNVVYSAGITGYMQLTGLGTDRDLSGALTQFSWGAEQGDQYSAEQVPVTEAKLACQDAAGSPHERGGAFHGVAFDALDADVAIPACEEAMTIEPVVAGDAVWLARAYLKAGRFEDAVPLLEEGIDADSALAQSLMADLKLGGLGVPADAAGAIGLYRRAADDGFAPAAYALGLAYKDGVGIDADLVEAKRWLELAASYGYEEAEAQVALLAERLTPEPVTYTGFRRAGPAY